MLWLGIAVVIRLGLVVERRVLWLGVAVGMGDRFGVDAVVMCCVTCGWWWPCIVVGGRVFRVCVGVVHMVLFRTWGCVRDELEVRLLAG